MCVGEVRVDEVLVVCVKNELNVRAPPLDC